jgi:protein-S-isoprenylcysteine O-methyltransferase Ste14
MIIYFARPEPAYAYTGTLLLLMGETIRLWSVSYAGGETRTRNVGAKKLCSSGPYAFVRNPLYVGNMFMYMGIVFIAGAANVWLMIATTLAFFIVQYSLIIALEEEKLDELFGKEYQTYKNNVPSVFPRIFRWRGSDHRSPRGIIKSIRTEKRTIQNVFFILFLIVLRTQVFL